MRGPAGAMVQQAAQADAGLAAGQSGASRRPAGCYLAGRGGLRLIASLRLQLAQGLRGECLARSPAGKARSRAVARGRQWQAAGAPVLVAHGTSPGDGSTLHHATQCSTWHHATCLADATWARLLARLSGWLSGWRRGLAVIAGRWRGLELWKQDGQLQYSDRLEGHLRGAGSKPLHHSGLGLSGAARRPRQAGHGRAAAPARAYPEAGAQAKSRLAQAAPAQTGRKAAAKAAASGTGSRQKKSACAYSECDRRMAGRW